ncbi:MAG: hypothetical protein ACI4KM_05415 [Oscillospiraceae bacterium]
MTFYGKAASALVALGIAGLCAAYTAQQGAEALAQAKQIADDVTRCYVIGEYEGKIALFEDGNTEPLAVYSSEISDLTAADALLIRDGIRLRTLTEVSRLLEDLEIE